MMLINEIDLDALRERVRAAKPFPFFCIDNFLDGEFAAEVEESFPSLREASQLGKSFSAVNEKGKIQVPDSSKFPPPIMRLHELLSSPEWLAKMSYVMDIPDLVADPGLAGGGIHETGPRGHLDVHVDFNYLKDHSLHRRLNILVYFNRDWEEGWGGNIELWDSEVQQCHHSLSPAFNRCVVFATSDISYHGVTAVRCPEGRSRKSFAAYYYTAAAPDGWDGTVRSTVFKARPTERFKGVVAMPAERLGRIARRLLRRLRRQVSR